MQKSRWLRMCTTVGARKSAKFSPTANSSDLTAWASSDSNPRPLGLQGVLIWPLGLYDN